MNGIPTVEQGLICAFLGACAVLVVLAAFFKFKARQFRKRYGEKFSAATLKGRLWIHKDSGWVMTHPPSNPAEWEVLDL